MRACQLLDVLLGDPLALGVVGGLADVASARHVIHDDRDGVLAHAVHVGDGNAAGLECAQDGRLAVQAGVRLGVQLLVPAQV